MSIFKTLRFKVSLLFVAVMLLLEIILLYYNIYAIRTIRNQVAQSYMKLLPSIVGKMDDSLSEVRNYLIRTMNPNGDNSDIVTFNLSAKESTEYYYSMSNIFQKLGKDINYFGMAVDSLFVYSQQNDELISFTTVLYDNTRDYGKINLSLKDLARNAAKKGTKSQWEVHMMEGSPGLVCIISNSAGCYIGARIDINRLLMEDNSEKKDQNGALIMTEDGNILLSTNPGIPNKEIIAGCSIKDKSGFQTISLPNNRNKYLVITQTAKKAGITYVQMINEKVLTENFSFFQTMIVILPIGLLVILMVYFAFLQGILLKPIKELVKGMKRIIHGDLEVKLEENGPEEILLVINTFNSMVSQIHKLKIDIYEGELKAKNADLKAANADLKAANAELDAKKAELKSLQLQINPHFFANSLNIVYNLAALNNNKAVQKMAIYLSNYFRYLLQAGNSMSELRQEIEFIRNYLGIQKLRFTSRLEFEISVPEKYMLMKIPPLLLQPLVENSIVHGFKDSGQTLIIKISAEPHPKLPEKNYIVSVQDNGKGFPEYDSIVFSDQEYSDNETGNHIGMKNIIDRLKTAFGENANLISGNGSDGGAVVKVYLPVNEIIKGEEDDQNV